MYNGIEKIKEVIDYIEENITEEISCDVLAAKMNLSVYEFRRIFSFIVGCPISNYIRKRRLSLAACEILSDNDVDLSILSQKYGYSNLSAFTKAFKEQHGVSPGAYLKGEQNLKLFTLPKFEMSVSGREDISVKIVKSDEFYVSGFVGISTFTDTCCCENVWDEFYGKGYDKRLEADNLYAAYKNSDSNVECTIGIKSEYPLEEFKYIKIPSTRYACFGLATTDDDLVNKKYSRILYEWLPSANLRYNRNLPIIEVYPFDMSEDGFKWEIRIPIE